MAEELLSDLTLERFAIRRLVLDVQSELDGDAHSASVGLNYEFFQHETDDSRFRVAVDLEVRSVDTDEPLFMLEVSADAFVEVPPECAEAERALLLTNGVALLYSTLRGSLAGLLGQTALHGFVLPAIDINRVARAREVADEAAAVS